MTRDEQQTVIHHYLAAYNRFDVAAMVALVHPDVVFQHVTGGQVNAKAVGADAFRDLARQSKALFSSRHQQVTNFTFTGELVITDMAYEGVLASDLPNGMKAGETLRLSGRSEFVFKDNKLYRITDFSA